MDHPFLHSPWGHNSYRSPYSYFILILCLRTAMLSPSETASLLPSQWPHSFLVSRSSFLVPSMFWRNTIWDAWTSLPKIRWLVINGFKDYLSKIFLLPSCLIHTKLAEYRILCWNKKKYIYIRILNTLLRFFFSFLFCLRSRLPFGYPSFVYHLFFSLHGNIWILIYFFFKNCMMTCLSVGILFFLFLFPLIILYTSGSWILRNCLILFFGNFLFSIFLFFFLKFNLGR